MPDRIQRAFRWLAVFLFAVVTTVAAEGNATNLDRPFDPVSTGFVVHDPDLKLTPLEAASIAHEERMPWAADTIRRGGKAYWLVFDIVDDPPRNDWALAIYSAWFQHVDLYTVVNGEAVGHRSAGSVAAARARVRSVPAGYVLPLDLLPDEKHTIAIRLQSDLMHHFPAEIGPAEDLENKMLFRRVAALLIVGAMLGLIGYNLYLGISLRNVQYLFYTLHAFSYLAFSFDHHGFTAGLFSRTDHLAVAVLSSAGSQLFAGLFIGLFLNLATTAPRLNIGLRLLMGVILFATASLPVIGYYWLTDILMTTYPVLTVLILLGAVHAIRNHNRSGWYVLFGWAPILASSIIVLLAGGSGYVEVPYSYSIVVIAIILNEMVMMSLALADRVRRLEAEKQVIENVASTKSRYLSTISHEIRTPVNGILGLMEELRGGTSHQKELINQIRDAARALVALLNNILDRESGKEHEPVSNPEPFDMRRLVSSTVDLLRPSAQFKSLGISADVGEAVPDHVVGEAVLLRQVLVNLIENAIKFTSEGKVRVRVDIDRIQDGRIYVRFEVSDSGQGVAEKEQKAIFEPFAQLSDRRSSIDGIGLGLALSRQLVAHMGGHLGVSSEPGSGTTFHFVIPLFAASQAAPSQESVAMQSLAGIRILIVDDVEVNRKVLKGDLTRAGAEALEAASGEEALHMTDNLEVDAVVTDLRMPAMSGVELVRSLRKKGVRTPVIGLTADGAKSTVADCLTVGMNEVLLKPPDPEILLLTILRLVEEIRGRSGKQRPIDFDRIRQNRDAQGAAAFDEQISEFFDYADALVGKLRSASHCGDYRTLSAQAHRLAGAASMMGFSKLGSLANELSQASETRPDADIDCRIDELSEALAELRGAF